MSTNASVTDDAPEQRPQNGCLRCLKNNLFMLTIIAGVLVGFAIGFGLRELPTISEELKIWIGLKNIITSSVFSNAWRHLHPGSEADHFAVDYVECDCWNVFPDNIVGIAIFQVVTGYKNLGINITTNETMFQRVVANEDGTNMIGVIFVAVAFGLAASGAKEKGEPFLEFCASIADVVLKLIRAFLKATPVGVCFMIAGAIVKVDDIAGTFAKLGLFIVTVIAGIAVLFILTLVVYVIGARKNPFTVIPHLMQAWFLGFATTSAIVTVPEIYEGCDALHVRKGLSRFVAPLAATLKADGSACFIVSGALFVAQMDGKSTPGNIVVIW
ncbi:hypothetical protein SprV_0100311400 [Sparganum proliferum]